MAVLIPLCNSMAFSPDMLNLAFGSPHISISSESFTEWQVPLLKSSDRTVILLLSRIIMKQIDLHRYSSSRPKIA